MSWERASSGASEKPYASSTALPCHVAQNACRWRCPCGRSGPRRQACPSCTHHWPIAGDAIEVLDLEIATFSKILLLEEKPATTEADVDRYQRVLDAWDEAAWFEHADAPEKAPELPYNGIRLQQLKAGLESKQRREELVTQLDQVKAPTNEPDYAVMLRERQQYEAQLAVYSNQVDEYEAWEREKSKKMTQLLMLDIDLQEYAALSQALDQARAYEQYLSIYDKQLETYNKGVGQVTAYRADAEDWKKVKDALVILRSKIKQYLVPSLNKVASALLFNMTGGDRQAIVCDEDFNITVDGQEINTLSGSGKAVANLALRLGLGQVLTNNVLSLFIGDEIDASMDANRAENTSRVL
jgi:DNA repair exonuclease SbcCD ATPase subunit